MEAEGLMGRAGDRGLGGGGVAWGERRFWSEEFLSQ